MAPFPPNRYGASRTPRRTSSVLTDTVRRGPVRFGVEELAPTSLKYTNELAIATGSFAIGIWVLSLPAISWHWGSVWGASCAAMPVWRFPESDVEENRGK